MAYRKHAPRGTLRFQECERKIGYDTNYEAVQAMITTEADGFRGKLHIYDCPHCKKLHIGHAKKNRRKR